jgi:hypothetical protein
LYIFWEAHLKLFLEKFQFFRKEVGYLDHLISSRRITIYVYPETLKVILELPIPKNKHGIRSFLGLCTYYSLSLVLLELWSL